MLVSRDRLIINHIIDFKAVNSSQIQRLFFRDMNQGVRIANRRLAMITKLSEIKSMKDRYSMRHIYYHGSKSQVYHKLHVSEFYARLIESGAEVVEFKREFMIGSLRADAFTIFKKGGFKYHVFLEVQLSHEPLDTEKYDRLASSGNIPWPTFPMVVVISDRNYAIKSPIKFVQIGTDFGGWDRVFNLT